jgi:membrane-bound inhibitor of C-type lysozyme
MHSKNVELAKNARIVITMRKKVVIAIAVILLVIAFTSCSTIVKEKLNVELTQEVEYLCSDESKIEARFYALTDNSLNFVKVKMVDGKEYTLPQVIAASGARYSDEYSLQFWIKGNSMTLYKMNEEREWEILKEGTVKE